MEGLSLREVRAHLTFECVLCGRELSAERVAAHAEQHARHGECWSYAGFTGACQIDGDLEGWPVVSPEGDELLWPFWERTDRLAARCTRRALAV